MLTVRVISQFRIVWCTIFFMNIVALGYSQNLVLNGGFENGNSNWSLTSPANASTASANPNCGGQNMHIGVDGSMWQDGTCVASSPYSFDFDAIMTNTSSGWASVQLQIFDGAWTHLETHDIPLSNGSWTNFSNNYTTPPTAAFWGIWAGAGNGSELRVDCMELTYDGSTGTSCGQVENFDFEAGTVNWTLSPNSSITTDSYSGTQAIHLGSGIGGIYQEQPAIEGTTYTLEAYGKKSGSDIVLFSLDFYDSSGANIKQSNVHISSSTYEPYYISSIAPPGATVLKIVAWKATSTSTGYVDDFCLDTWSLTEETCSNSSCDLGPSLGLNFVYTYNEVTFPTEEFKDYDIHDLILCDNLDDTYTIKGNVIHGRDALWDSGSADQCGSQDGWHLEITIFDKQSWTEFQGSYVVDASCSNAYLNLDYWDVSGVMTGLGCNSGRVVTIDGPSPGYRLQIGTGGNSQNCGFGMSTWFSMTENGVALNSDIYSNFSESCYNSLVAPSCACVCNSPDIGALSVDGSTVSSTAPSGCTTNLERQWRYNPSSATCNGGVCVPLTGWNVNTSLVHTATQDGYYTLTYRELSNGTYDYAENTPVYVSATTNCDLTNPFPGFPIDFQNNNCSWIDYDLSSDLSLFEDTNGEYRITGKLTNAVDADWDGCTTATCGSDDEWIVDLVMSDKMNWTEFQAAGGSANVHASCSADIANLDYWDISGTLTGIGCNDGDVINITGPKAPYRLQIGNGGNSGDAACDFGMSTWFDLNLNGTTLNADIYAFLTESCYNNLVSSTSTCDISVRALGSCGGETLELRLDGTTVATFSLSTSFQTYTYSGYNGTDAVSVHFVDVSGCDYNARIDYIEVAAYNYQTETLGTHSNTSCNVGEWLWCSGSIDFGALTCAGCGIITNPGEVSPPVDYIGCDATDPSEWISDAPATGCDVGTLSYQWQEKNPATGSVWTNIDGATNETYDPPYHTESNWIRRAAYCDPCGDWAYSNVTDIHVSVNYTSPGSLSGNQSICLPATATTLTASAPIGGVYEYDGWLQSKWESRVPGGTWDTITGYANVDYLSATADVPLTYEPGPLANTLEFRRCSRIYSCSDWLCTNAVTVSVYSLPNVSLGLTNNESCIESTTLALDGGVPAGGNYSGTGVTGTNFDASVAGIGTHTITYTYTDGYGCTNSATADVEVFDLPLVTLNLPVNVACVSENSLALTGASPAGGSYSGITVTGNNFDPSVAGVGTHTITYTYTDINGCTSSDMGTIQVLGAEPGEIAHSIIACPENDPGIIENIEDASYCNYIDNHEANEGLDGWHICSHSSVTIPIIGSIDNSSVLSGVNSTYLEIEEVTDKDWHHQVMFFDNDIIAGETYTISFEAKATGVKDMRVMLQLNEAPWTAYFSEVVTLGTAANNYSLTYTATESITGVRLIFNLGSNGEDVWLDNIELRNNNCTEPAIDYIWECRESDGNGGWSAWATITGATGASYDPPVQNNNKQYRRLSSITVCDDYTSSNIIQIDLCPCEVSVDQDSVICVGDIVDLQAIATGAGELSYMWSPTTGLDNASIANPEASPIVTTTYTVTVTDILGCTSTDDVTITVTTAATATVTGETICTGESATILSTVNGASGTINYQWQSSPNGTTSWTDVTGATSATYTTPILLATSYYRLIISTSGEGCSESITNTAIVIVEQASIAITATAEPEVICLGGSATLTVNEDISTGDVIDYSVWTTGVGNNGDYTVNGTNTENHRITDTDPWGNPTVVWEARPDASSNADGGWNMTPFPIDHTKLYRVSVWVNRKVIGNDGSFYLGTRGYGGTDGLERISDGTTTTNPYFWVSDSPPSSLMENEWVLVIGHIYPSSHTGSANHNDSGRYTVSDGKIGGINNDYQFLPTTTTSVHRSYLYFCTDISVRQQWVYPRFDIVDGTEPSVDDLLSGFDVNGGLGDGATWEWYEGSCAGTYLGSGTSLVVTPTVTTTYYVRAEGDCNTSDCQSITVSVANDLSIELDLEQALCSNDSTNIVASMTGGSSPFTYNWDGPGGFSSTEPSISVTEEGAYIITVTDDNGCSSTAMEEIIVHDLPLVTLSLLTTASCVSDTIVVLSGQSPEGGDFAGTGITGTSFDPSAAGVGTHIITYTYTDDNGCSNSATDEIVVHDLPIVTLSLPTTEVCITDTAVALSGHSPDGGEYSGIGVTGTTFDPSSVGTGTYTITYSYTDLNGCINAATEDIIVHDLPTVNLSLTTVETCISDSSVVLSGHSPAGGSYTGTGVTGTTFDPGFAGIGTHTITYSYTTAEGCTNFDLDTIEVFDLPVVSLALAQDEACLGEVYGALNGGNPTGGSYSGNGVASGYFDTMTAGPGDHEITYAFIDARGCENSAVDTIHILDLPTVELSLGIATACVIESSIALSGGTPDGGEYTGAGVTGTTFDPSDAGEGIHTITYSYMDEYGCINSATDDFVVNGLPEVTLALSDNNACILDTGVVLSGQSPTGGFFSGTAVSGSTFDPSIAGLGTHTVTYTYTDDNGCTGTAIAEIVVHESPLVTLELLIDSACVEETTLLLDGGFPAGGTYSGIGVAGTNFNPSVAGVGVHTITYTYSDTIGCTSSVVDDLTVINAPTVSLVLPNDQLCVTDDVITLSGQFPAGGYFSGLGVTGNTFDPSVAGVGVHTITYTYVDSNGCSGSATDEVTISDQPIVALILGIDEMCIDAGVVTLTGESPPGGYFSGTGVTGSGFDPIEAGIGSHTITYTYTDANNCIHTATDIFTIHGAPSVVLNLTNTSTCLNNGILSLEGQSPVGGAFSGLGVSGSSFDPAIAGLGNHTITYTYGDANNCLGMDTAVLTVYDSSDCSYDCDGDGVDNCSDCAPEDLTIATLIGSACDDGDPLTYNDQYDANCNCVGFSCSNSQAEAGGTVVSSNGSYQCTTFTLPETAVTIYFSVTDLDSKLNGSPSGRFQDQITVSYLDTLGATIAIGTYTSNQSIEIEGPIAAIVVCIEDIYDGSSPPLSVTVSTINYCPICDFLDPIILTLDKNSVCTDEGVIALSGGSPSGGSYSGAGVLNNQFDPLVAGVGDHTITYEYTDSNGCNDTATDIVSVISAINTTVSSSEVICLGESIQLTASGGSSYSWSPAAGLNNSSIANPIANPTITTLYSVTITGGNGCTSVEQVSVFVNECNPPSTCHFLHEFNTDSYYGSDGTESWLAYSWDESGDNNSALSGDVSIMGGRLFMEHSDASLPSIRRRVDLSLYSSAALSLDLWNTGGLDNLDVFSVEVSDGSNWYTLIELQGSIAGMQTLQFNISPYLSADTEIRFSITNGYTDSGEHLEIDNVRIGVDCLCEGIAEAGADLEVCLGDSIQLVGVGGGQYSWSPVASLSDSDISNPLAFPSAATIYTLTVIDENGCSDTDELVVSVNASVSASVLESLSDDCQYGEGQTLLNITSGEPPFIVSWQSSDGSQQGSTTMNNLGNYNITGLDGGITYCIDIVDSNGCKVDPP